MRLYSNNLLGDTLLQTPAIRTWKKQNPDQSLVYTCGTTAGSMSLLADNPYIDALIPSRYGPAPTEPDEVFVNMDASVAFGLGASNGKSLSWGYGRMLGVEIDSLAYDYTMTVQEELVALHTMCSLTPVSKPIVLVARHSASCTSNDPNIRVANKCVTNRIWVQVARWLIQEGFTPVAIGSSKDAEDSRYKEWPGKTLYGEDIRDIAALTSVCAAVLTVDNGIRHITAAAGGNLFCISGRIPLSLISCVPVREGQKIYEVYRELPLVSASTIIDGAQKVLNGKG